MAARGLAAGSTRVIGLVIPVGITSIFADPYIPLVIQGVSSACNHLGYSIMLWLAEPQYERQTIGQIIHNGLMDGVIVVAMLLDDPLIDRLCESKRPFVTIGRHPTYDTVPYVDVDNHTGAYQAVSFAIRSGHRRVALIGGFLNSISGRDRYQGYLDALQGHGYPVIPELITEGDYSDWGGYQAMKRLLPFHPDAVFAASDAMALAAMRAIQEAGLRIPEDIAVIGFDDIPPAATSSPPLTTIRQPIQQTGKLVAEMLIDMIEKPDPLPRQVVLPVELVVRSSCQVANGQNPVWKRSRAK
jgi:LacI family transcriptional regulator